MHPNQFLANRVTSSTFLPVKLEQGGVVGIEQHERMSQAFRQATLFSANPHAVQGAIRTMLYVSELAGSSQDAGARGTRLFNAGLVSKNPVWLEFDLPPGPARQSFPVLGPSRVGCLFEPGLARGQEDSNAAKTHEDTGDSWWMRAAVVALPNPLQCYALPALARYDADGELMEPDAEVSEAWELLDGVVNVASLASAVLAAHACGFLKAGCMPDLGQANLARARRGKPALLAPVPLLSDPAV